MTPTLAILLLYVLPAILFIAGYVIMSKTFTVYELGRTILWALVPLANLMTCIIVVALKISELKSVQNFLNKKIK